MQNQINFSTYSLEQIANFPAVNIYVTSTANRERHQNAATAKWTASKSANDYCHFFPQSDGAIYIEHHHASGYVERVMVSHKSPQLAREYAKHLHSIGYAYNWSKEDCGQYHADCDSSVLYEQREAEKVAGGSWDMASIDCNILWATDIVNAR